MTHVSAATLEKPQRVKDTVVLSEIVIAGSRRRRESEVASNTSESDGIPLLGKFSERRTYMNLSPHHGAVMVIASYKPRTRAGYCCLAAK